MTPLPRRILLVEDDFLFYDHILEMLRGAGYIVDHAKSLREALEFVYSQHYHLLITDMALDGHPPQRGETNKGAELLDNIRASVLKNSLTRIVITNYPETAWMDGRKQWYFFRVIEKYDLEPDESDDLSESDYLTRLKKAIEDAFHPGRTIEDRLQAHIYHNPNLTITYVADSDTVLIPAIVKHIMDDEGVKLNEQVYQTSLKQNTDISLPPLSAEVLQQQVYDLIGKLFMDDDKVFISKMIQGLTGASVVRAVPSHITRGPGQRYVLKIGRRDKIEREYNNYRDHVFNQLMGGAITALDTASTRDLGAIKYRFAQNDRNAELREFDMLYFDTDISNEAVANSLRILFESTFWWLYNTRKAELESLTTKYYEAFELQEKGNIQRVVDEIMRNSDLAQYITYFKPQAPEFHVVALDAPLINPIQWLEENKAWGVMTVWYAVTHGDLTGRNIMSDISTLEYQDEALEHCKLWLIDFYRTGRSHILRDHVILETDIKYRLLENWKLETFLELEQRLMLPDYTGKTLKDSQVMQSLARAQHVIETIRDCANDQTHSNQKDEKQLEFYFALLMATLNVIRLKHIKPLQKLKALISASLICSCIQDIKVGGVQYPNLSRLNPRDTQQIPAIGQDNPPPLPSEEIVQALKERRLMLFVGRRAGQDDTYPTPYKLSGELMDEIHYTPISTENHRKLASLYAERRGPDVLRKRHDAYYARFSLPPVFPLIAQLPWGDIFTTNQHSYLETALDAANNVHYIIQHPREFRASHTRLPIVYKLYGSLDDKEAAPPLTDEEYERPEYQDYTRQCQQIMLERLRGGESIILLYPSSTDIETLRNLMKNISEQGMVYIVGKDMPESERVLIGKSRMRYLGVSPIAFLEQMQAAWTASNPDSKKRDQIFISYAHRDAEYLKELLSHLKPLERHGVIPRPWSDEEIKIGESWREAINEALNRARVAILLISPAFINSEFITNEELRPILEARARGEILVFPVALRHVAHSSLDILADIQWANDPAHPIAADKREEARDVAWVDIVNKLASTFGDLLQ